MALADEVVGQRFGKWLVVENLGPVQFGNRTRAMVRCVCECGTGLRGGRTSRLRPYP
jgi:hypothetical protein